MNSAHSHAESIINLPKLPFRDLELQNQVKSQIHCSGYRGLQKIECQVHEDLVILSGTVSSYYLKQIVQTVVMKIDGVKAIENHLRVHSANSSQHEGKGQ